MLNLNDFVIAKIDLLINFYYIALNLSDNNFFIHQFI